MVNGGISRRGSPRAGNGSNLGLVAHAAANDAKGPGEPGDSRRSVSPSTWEKPTFVSDGDSDARFRGIS